MYDVPYGVAYPILQASLVVGGLLGITVFREIREPKATDLSSANPLRRLRPLTICYYLPTTTYPLLLTHYCLPTTVYSLLTP